jgi:protoporphyrinogen oxidase
MTNGNGNIPEARWAVVGGGMMGLVAALRLAERGQKVTLLEAGPELGGLTAAWRLGNVEWDKFYHVITLSDSRLRSLLSSLNLDQEIEWVQTRSGFYSEGKLYSLSSSLDFLKFPPLNLYQKFRLGSTIFWGSKIRDWKSMEGMLVEDWLTRWSGRSTFQKIWQPLLKCKLGDAYTRTSAGFIWAYIDRMYKARRSGMKREMFGYVPGGYRRILIALKAKLVELGVTIVCNAPVQRVYRESDSRSMFTVTYGREEDARSETFDRVVMTAPYSQVIAACHELTHDEVARMQSTEYLGVTCTSLLLNQPLGGYYVTNILDRWVPLTGIIEMGSILNPEKLGGHYLVYLPQYMLADDPRFEESDETVHERCLSTLEKMYPTFRRDQVAAIQTARAKHVMALPTRYFSENRPDVVLSQPGLYLLNSARIVKGTLNVNETLELLDEGFDESVWPHHLLLASDSSCL